MNSEKNFGIKKQFIVPPIDKLNLKFGDIPHPISVKNKRKESADTDEAEDEKFKSAAGKNAINEYNRRAATDLLQTEETLNNAFSHLIPDNRAPIIPKTPAPNNLPLFTPVAPAKTVPKSANSVTDDRDVQVRADYANDQMLRYLLLRQDSRYIFANLVSSYAQIPIKDVLDLEWGSSLINSQIDDSPFAFDKFGSVITENINQPPPPPPPTGGAGIVAGPGVPIQPPNIFDTSGQAKWDSLYNSVVLRERLAQLKNLVEHHASPLKSGRILFTPFLEAEINDALRILKDAVAAMNIPSSQITQPDFFIDNPDYCNTFAVFVSCRITLQRVINNNPIVEKGKNLKSDEMKNFIAIKEMVLRNCFKNILEKMSKTFLAKRPSAMQNFRFI